MAASRFVGGNAAWGLDPLVHAAELHTGGFRLESLAADGDAARSHRGWDHYRADLAPQERRFSSPYTALARTLHRVAIPFFGSHAFPYGQLRRRCFRSTAGQRGVSH